MNITFKSNSFGETYMDLPQFKVLDEARNQYNISKSSTDGDAYYQALINILDLLISYAADVFKGKIFSDEHLISQVFLTETDIKNENAYKQYIRYSLYVASDFASTMKNNILSRKHLDRYECLSLQIESDFEWLIAQYEICFKGANEIIILHGSAPDLMPRQILFATNQLFYLEETPQISDLDFRNIKPYMMFLLRQLLELLGKNLIGYQNIIDKNGRIVPKMTQVAWQFLHKGNNGEKWRIEIPLPLHCIVRLNKWANGFVHTTKINRVYLQFYALTVVAKIMKIPNVGIDTFFKRNHICFNFGDFRVSNYYWLKKDFEKFVWDSGKNYVEWKPLDKVGGYLQTYGRPKALFVINLPPPIHGQSMVGAMIRDSHLINDNFDITYLNTSSSSTIEDIGKFKLIKLKNYCKLLFSIYKNVKKDRPEFVYLTPVAKGVAFYRDFLLVTLLKLLHCKIIIHYHNKGVATKQHKKLDNWLYKHFFRNVKVILLSDKLYNDINKYVIPKNVFICPNGIQNNIPGKIPIRDNSCTKLLFLSNLIKEKGVVVLLEACKILNDKGIKFCCTFAGGESKEMTQEGFYDLVKEFGLEGCVEYIGKQFGNDKEKCYIESDIFVLPTFYHNECFPLVLLEAMSYGIACVSTAEGAISDIIEDGVTGFIVEQKNSKDLAKKLEILIKNSALRKDMGSAGKEKFERLYTQEKFEWNLFNILHFIG